MALDQTPYIDPLTEPDRHESRPAPAPRRKRADQPETPPDPSHVEGLDPEKELEDDDVRVPPPPHFV
jgi:hypothetical protein